MLLLLTGLALAAPDRSAPPPVEPAVPLEQPAMVRETVRPGLDLVLVPVDGMRKTRISFIFRRGRGQMAPDDPAPFIAMGWAWDQASDRFPGEELSIYEDLHDVDVWSTSGFDHATVHLDAPLSALEPGLDLLHDVVHHPDFQRRDLARLRDFQSRWYLREATTDGGALIDGGLDHVWIPEDHPLDPRPDVAGWLSTRLRDLRHNHRALLETAPLTVVVIGDLSLEQVRARILPIADGLGQPGELPDRVPFTPPEGVQVLGVDLRGTGRASLGLRLSAPVYDDEDAAAFSLIDHAMGGHFLSRLNADLRETRGLTYGIDSTWGAGPSVGTWTLLTEVSAEDAAEAIGAIRDQLDAVASEGLTEAELADATQARIADWNATFTTIPRAARTYVSRIHSRRTTAQARARLDACGRISVADSRAVAQRWIGEGPRAWVIVGERRVLEPQLEALGLEADWLPGELVVLGAGVGPAGE